MLSVHLSPRLNRVLSASLCLSLLSGSPLICLAAEPTEGSVQQLQASLLEAQKQAYEKELELNKLRSQVATQQQKQNEQNWVPVSVSGSAASNAEQPAINKSTPEALQTSLQYYKHQYILKPGDKLLVNFIGEDPIRGTYKESAGDDVNSSFLSQLVVLTDGTIILPPFGLLEVAGKTLKQVNEELNNNLSNYYRFATITVSLAEAAQDDVLVLGRVKQQGHIKLPVGTTISQIIDDVGGLEDDADLSHIFIRKKDSGNVYVADLKAFLESGNTAQDIMLQSGDVVVVSQGSETLSYDALASSGFLPKEFEVKVLGAVTKPDAYKMNPGDDVGKALAKAGGALPHTGNSKILVLREDPQSKTIQTVELKQKDLADPQKALTANVALKPNDLIFIPDSRGKRALFNLFTNTGLSASAFFASQSLFHTLFASKSSK